MFSIDFASNDYLGFARSAQLKRAILHGLEQSALLGSTGSRLLTGNSPLCEQLEAKIAAYHNEPAGLIFSSGYLANVGLLSSIASRTDTILYDEKIHASIRDGIRLSCARSRFFCHFDVDDLEKHLHTAPKGTFVVVESLCGTDGTIAPLRKIAALCTRYGARLIVDEAHATGVFGPGLVNRDRIKPFARVHTFGKALGVQGAIVLGSRKLCAFLISCCRPFIYTTAPSYLSLIAISAAYDLLMNTTHTLLERCEMLDQKTPIRIVSREVGEALKQAGMHVNLLRYPTVKRKEECYRVCMHTFNTEEQIDELQQQLHRHGY